jgi:X-X-X-Leu-X-X-Gly heptad repeat protein
LKNGVQQAIITGDGNAIFNALSQGGKTLQSGAVQLTDGTILFSHTSTTTGQFTLDINTGAQIYKIRINP